MLVNTARGSVVNIPAVYQALKDGRMAYFGADLCFGGNGRLPFYGGRPVPEDELLGSLSKLPNVIITPHIAQATTDALANVANICFGTINNWLSNHSNQNEISLKERGRS
jgi:phosphoglycerate dehydrogenase-like enzyme